LQRKKDYWWHLEGNTSFELLTKKIATVLNTLAIPEMEKCITNEYLKNE